MPKNNKGSSPRVWGQVNIFFKLLRRVRIIPTRVGTSYYPNLTKNLCRDHPHACGDKSPLQQTVIQKPGSSPRVWGQVPKNTLRFPCAGIIPTRVGTRIFKTSSDTIKKDHPHACGDKSAPANIIQKGVGSSPRVWGQVIEDIFIDLAHGIIPTRVGTRYQKY